MADDHVIAKVSADITDIKTGLANVVKEFKAMGERVAREAPQDPFKELKANIRDVGQVMGAVTPFVQIVKDTAQFDQAMRNVNKVTRLNEEAFRAYGDQLRTVSLELKTSTDLIQNAAAAEKIASSGFEDTASAAKVLEAVLVGATAGMAESGQYAEFLSQSLNAMGRDANMAAHYNDVLFTTVEKGITSFPELAQMLGRATGAAGAAGVSFEELNAIVAVTTLRGAKTEAAVDGIRGAIMNLQTPSKQAKDEMARLGIEVNEQTLRQKGLVQTLREIAKANGNSGASWKRLLGDVQAVVVAELAMADSGHELLSTLNEMETRSGTAAAALEEHNKGAVASWERMQVAVKSAAAGMGQFILPALVTLLDVGTSVVSTYAQAPAAFQAATTAIAVMGAVTLVTFKAVKLLTTSQQQEAIATAASSAAKILNTNAGVAMTAGIIKTQIAVNGLTARLAASTISVGGFSAMMATARTTTLGLAASLGPLLIAGGALIGVAWGLANAWKEAAESQDKYTDAAAKSTAKLGDALRSAGKSAQELFASGTSSRDLNDQLEALRQGAENIKEMNLAPADEAARLKTIEKAIVKIRGERTKLVEIEKEDAARKKAEAEAKFGGGDNGKAEEAAGKKAAKDAEKARKEALAQDLHAIEVLKKAGELSARQEIAQLEEIKTRRKLNAEELRDLEEKQASARGKIQDHNEERWKKAAEAGKEAAQKNFDLRQKALETDLEGTKSLEDQLELEKQLVDLEAQKALYGEKNKKNRDQILANAKAEKDLLDKQSKEAVEKRDADLASKRADLVASQASEEAAAQEDVFAKRRRALDEEAASGKNVYYEKLKLEQEELDFAMAASKKRLENLKAELAAKRKAADVGATPAEQKINADTEQLEIKKAERQAAKETQDIYDRSTATLVEQLKHLRERLELIKKNKEAAKGPSFSGEAYGPEGLNENRAGLGVSRSQREAENEMSQTEVEAEIARTKGMLGNRKTYFDKQGQLMPTFGVSKSEREKAAASAAAAPKNQGEVQAKQLSTQESILKLLGQAVGKAAGSTKDRGSPSLGLAPNMYPNTSF